MSPEAQQIAIAEACEWRDIKRELLGITGTTPKRNLVQGYGLLPNYLTDLNAMREAEKHLVIGVGGNSRLRSKYRQILQTIVKNAGESENYWGHASAIQRAEALLRTIGK